MKWTEEAVREAASQFNSRSEFSKGANTAYKKAFKLEIMEDLFPSLQQTESETVESETVESETVEPVARNRWTEEAVRAEASKYSTRAEFSKASHAAYRKALKLEILDDLIASTVIRWTEEKLREEASKYSSRNEFKKASGGAYHKASKLGIMDQIMEV